MAAADLKELHAKEDARVIRLEDWSAFILYAFGLRGPELDCRAHLFKNCIEKPVKRVVVVYAPGLPINEYINLGEPISYTPKRVEHSVIPSLGKYDYMWPTRNPAPPFLSQLMQPGLNFDGHYQEFEKPAQVVWDPAIRSQLLRGIKRTRPTIRPRNGFKNWTTITQPKILPTTDLRIFAVDCRYVYVGESVQLARFSLLNFSKEVVYSTFVKPTGEVSGPATAKSGIVRSDLDGVTTTREDVIKWLAENLEPGDILVGSAARFESSLLELDYPNFVDIRAMFRCNLRSYSIEMLAEAHLKYKVVANAGPEHPHGKAAACIDLIASMLKTKPTFPDVQRDDIALRLRRHGRITAVVTETKPTLYKESPLDVEVIRDETVRVNSAIELAKTHPLVVCQLNSLTNEFDKEGEPLKKRKLFDCMLEKLRSELFPQTLLIVFSDHFSIHGDKGQMKEGAALNEKRSPLSKELAALALAFTTVIGEKDSEAEVVSQSESKIESKLASEMDSKMKSQVRPAMGPEMESAVKLKMEPELDSKMKPEVELKPELELKPQLEILMEHILDPQSDLLMEAGTEPTIEPKLRPKVKLDVEQETSVDDLLAELGIGPTIQGPKPTEVTPEEPSTQDDTDSTPPENNTTMDAGQEDKSDVSGQSSLLEQPVDLKPQTKSRSESDIELVAEASVEIKLEPEFESEPRIESEPELELELRIDSEPVTESEPITEHELSSKPFQDGGEKRNSNESFELQTEAPSGVPNGAPFEKPIEKPIEKPFEAPIEGPIEGPIEAPIEAVIEATSEAATEAPLEATTEVTFEAPTKAPLEAPIETAPEMATEAPIEVAPEMATEAPIEAPVEATMDESNDRLIESAEGLIQARNDGPVEVLEVTTEEPAEAPLALSVEEPIEVSTNAQTEVSVVKNTEEPSLSSIHPGISDLSDEEMWESCAEIIDEKFVTRESPELDSDVHQDTSLEPASKLLLEQASNTSLPNDLEAKDKSDREGVFVNTCESEDGPIAKPSKQTANKILAEAKPAVSPNQGVLLDRLTFQPHELTDKVLCRGDWSALTMRVLGIESDEIRRRSNFLKLKKSGPIKRVVVLIEETVIGAEILNSLIDRRQGQPLCPRVPPLADFDSVYLTESHGTQKHGGSLFKDFFCVEPQLCNPKFNHSAKRDSNLAKELKKIGKSTAIQFLTPPSWVHNEATVLQPESRAKMLSSIAELSNRHDLTICKMEKITNDQYTTLAAELARLHAGLPDDTLLLVFSNLFPASSFLSEEAKQKNQLIRCSLTFAALTPLSGTKTGPKPGTNMCGAVCHSSNTTPEPRIQPEADAGQMNQGIQKDSVTELDETLSAPPSDHMREPPVEPTVLSAPWAQGTAIPAPQPEQSPAPSLGVVVTPNIQSHIPVVVPLSQVSLKSVWPGLGPTSGFSPRPVSESRIVQAQTAVMNSISRPDSMPTTRSMLGIILDGLMQSSTQTSTTATPEPVVGASSKPKDEQAALSNTEHELASLESEPPHDTALSPQPQPKLLFSANSEYIDALEQTRPAELELKISQADAVKLAAPAAKKAVDAIIDAGKTTTSDLQPLLMIEAGAARLLKEIPFHKLAQRIVSSNGHIDLKDVTIEEINFLLGWCRGPRTL